MALLHITTLNNTSFLSLTGCYKYNIYIYQSSFTTNPMKNKLVTLIYPNKFIVHFQVAQEEVSPMQLFTHLCQCGVIQSSHSLSLYQESKLSVEVSACLGGTRYFVVWNGLTDSIAQFLQWEKSTDNSFEQQHKLQQGCHQSNPTEQNKMQRSSIEDEGKNLNNCSQMRQGFEQAESVQQLNEFRNVAGNSRKGDHFNDRGSTKKRRIDIKEAMKNRRQNGGDDEIKIEFINLKGRVLIEMKVKKMTIISPKILNEYQIFTDKDLKKAFTQKVVVAIKNRVFYCCEKDKSKQARQFRKQQIENTQNTQKLQELQKLQKLQKLQDRDREDRYREDREREREEEKEEDREEIIEIVEQDEEREEDREEQERIDKMRKQQVTHSTPVLHKSTIFKIHKKPTQFRVPSKDNNFQEYQDFTEYQSAQIELNPERGLNSEASLKTGQSCSRRGNGIFKIRRQSKKNLEWKKKIYETYLPNKIPSI